jgi:hypothetical protein
MTYAIEVTDTFSGEANYCWVKRGSVPAMPEGLSRIAERRRAIAAVREVAGWPVSLRVSVDDYGDSLTIRPRGVCQVAFVQWEEV